MMSFLHLLILFVCFTNIVWSTSLDETKEKILIIENSQLLDNIFIKKAKLPEDIFDTIHAKRKEIDTQIEQNMKLFTNLENEIDQMDTESSNSKEKENKLKAEFFQLSDKRSKLQKDVELYKSRGIALNDEIQRMKKEIRTKIDKMNKEKLKEYQTEIDTMFTKINIKLEFQRDITTLMKNMDDCLKIANENLSNITRKLHDFYRAQSEKCSFISTKLSEKLEILNYTKTLNLSKPSNCALESRFSLDFWLQFLADHTALLQTHQFGNYTDFYKTTEDKHWLKIALGVLCKENLLKYICVRCLEFAKVKMVDGKKVDVILLENEEGIPLFFLKLKEEIHEILHHKWPHSNGFIIKPTRGVMSEGNILVKKMKNGFTTKTVDARKNFEKSYKNFEDEESLVNGIIDMIVNKSTWTNYNYKNYVFSTSSYEYSDEQMQTHLMIEELMDMPDDWFFPFELRITFLYGKPLVVWFIADHNAYLVIWRADQPHIIAYWETMFVLTKTFIQTKDFYDEKLIFNILEVCTKLAKYFNFVYGRIDVFTTKRNNEYVWYVNEVQNHGLAPDILYPDFLNPDNIGHNKKFCSIFPMRSGDCVHPVEDLSKIPNFYSFIDDVINMFPNMIEKEKLLFLYKKNSPLFMKLMKQILKYKMLTMQTDIQLQENAIEKTLNKIISTKENENAISFF